MASRTLIGRTCQAKRQRATHVTLHDGMGGAAGHRPSYVFCDDAAADERGAMRALRALDPARTAADVAAARREMEDAAFSRDRMEEAVRRLGERLREVKEHEEQVRRRDQRRDLPVRESGTIQPQSSCRPSRCSSR
jgi:hypothetical protein